MERVPQGLAGPPEDAGPVTAVEDSLRTGVAVKVAGRRDRVAPYRVSTPSAAVTFSVCVLRASPYVTVTR